MKARYVIVSFLVGSGMQVTAQAQLRPAEASVLSAFESRELTRELRRQQTFDRYLRVEQPVTFNFTIGGAYSKDPDGPRSTTVPVELTSLFDEKRTNFTVSMDAAYGRIEDSGESQTGHSELTLKLGHVFDEKRHWRGGIGVKVPTGSDLSAAHGSESANLSYATKIQGALSSAIIGSVSRSNVQPPAGISRTAQTGIVRFTSTFGPDDASDVWLQALGSHRSGTATYKEIGGGWDFPLSKGLDGALSMTKGLTDKARAWSVEFDVTFSF